MTIAHPEFEGFEVIQTVDNPALRDGEQLAVSG